MDDKLKTTFINQLVSFSYSLNDIVNKNKINKTIITEKIKYFNELKKFADQKCEQEVQNLFSKLEKFDDSLLKKYTILQVLSYVLLGLLFFLLFIKTKNKIINYFKNIVIFHKIDPPVIALLTP